jgi:hypothetical protein
VGRQFISSLQMSEYVSATDELKFYNFVNLLVCCYVFGECCLWPGRWFHLLDWCAPIQRPPTYGVMACYSMQDEYILFCVFRPFLWHVCWLNYISQPASLRSCSSSLGAERICNCYRPRAVVPDTNLSDILNKLCQACKSLPTIIYGDTEYSPKRFQSTC